MLHIPTININKAYFISMIPTHTHTHKHTHTYTYTNTHTHTHIYKPTHTHTYTSIDSLTMLILFNNGGYYKTTLYFISQ